MKNSAVGTIKELTAIIYSVPDIEFHCKYESSQTFYPFPLIPAQLEGSENCFYHQNLI